MRRAFALGVLVLVGCEPQLGDEYLCSTGGPCPPGWTCWADGVCRDAAPQKRLYEDCDIDADCDTRQCVPSTDDFVDDAGSTCSVACTEDDECDIGEQDGTCVGGFCRLSCLQTPDCPTGTQCWVPFDPGEPPEPRPACLNVMEPAFGAPPECTTPPDCLVPGICSVPPDAEAGVCAMACLLRGPPMMGGMPRPGTACPMGTECVDVYADAGLCLRPCDGTDAGCGEGTVCTELTINGETGSYCTGAGWDALGAFPLSSDLRQSLPMPMGAGVGM